MGGDQIDVALAKEDFFDAAEYCRRISVTKFGYKYSNRKGALGTQRAGHEIGAVIEAFGGREDALFSRGGDRIGARSAIENE